MRTYKLTCLLFCLTTTLCQAQVFPESDAIWNIQINGIEHYYGLSGDTTINYIVYNKLYLLNDTTLNIDTKDEYVGCFRQEGKKVWYRPAAFVLNYYYEDAKEETLLYDFSKSVGDTIWHNLVEQGNWYMGKNITASIIYSVDNQDYKIKYNTSQYINNGLDVYGNIDLYPMMGRTDSCIEGIGSLYSGLFWFLYYPPMSGGTSFKLVCFKQGNEVKYIDNTCNRCFCQTAVDITEVQAHHIDVCYENNSIRITGASSIFPCRLDLFNPMGQQLLSQNAVSDIESIPVTGILTGMYLYQLRKDNEIIKTGKLIMKKVE